VFAPGSDLPDDGRLAGAGAGRVGQRDVVVEGDPELDHRKQEQRQTGKASANSVSD
jgi:hypothetical protein